MAKTKRSRPALTSDSSARRINAILKLLMQGPATRLKISQNLGISNAALKNYIPHMRMKKLKKTIKVLTTHNEWRRGGDGEVLCPKEIGEAIAHALDVLVAVENLLKLPVHPANDDAAIAYNALKYASGVK